MKAAKYHVVWNFRNKLNKDKTAPVYVVVYIRDGERKFIHTGISVRKEQFDAKKGQVKNHNLQVKLNKRIKKIIDDISDYEYDLLNRGEEFTLQKLNSYLSRDNNLNFLEYMKKKADARNDITETTRTTHLSVVSRLKDFGKIKDFRDLVPEKLEKYEDFLKGENRCQNTIHKHMRAIRAYINLAIKEGYMDKSRNPFPDYKLKSGKPRTKVFLSEDEIEKLKGTDMPSESLELEKDLYLFSCYTGVADKDIKALTEDMIFKHNEDSWLVSSRGKTAVNYSVLLYPEALEIIEKYRGKREGYLFPIRSNQERNRQLKIVAGIAGISKILTTHSARHTFAVLMINNGVDMFTLSKLLGHSSVRTTEEYVDTLPTYLKEKMVEAYQRMRKRLE